MAATDALDAVARTLPELALKAALVFGAAAVLAFALRRRSAASRHLVWAVAMAGVLALPLAQLLPVRLAVLPASLAPAQAPAPAGANAADHPRPAGFSTSSRNTAAPQYVALPAIPSPARSADASSRGVVRGASGTTLLLAAWLLGALALLLRLAVGMGTAWWLGRTGERIDDEEWTAAADRISRSFGAPGARLVRSRWTAMPMTWGVLRPVVLLPAECDRWPAERREVVLRHELAHVARRDVLTLALAEVARALHWLNPLSWVALHQLRTEAERCCDDYVLRDGTRASTYAGHLLEMVRVVGRCRVPAGVALPMAQRSTFEGRLLAILEPGVERGAPGRARALATTGGLAALVVSLGAMRPAERAVAAERVQAVRGAAAPERPAAAAAIVSSAAAPELHAPPAAARSVDAPFPALAASDHPSAEVPPQEAVEEERTEPARMAVADADTLTPDQLIAMRTHGVTAEYVAEMRREFGRISLDQVVSLKTVGVTPAYLAEMRRHGYDRLTAGEATGMRAVGVNGAYVESLGSAGYRRVPAGQLTTMRAVGVSADYVREMARHGFAQLPAGELAQMRAVGVTPRYVTSLRAAGLGGLSASTITQLRAVGVTAEYIQELAGVGLGGLSLEDLTALRAHGVTAAYVRELDAAGLGPFDADQLVRLRVSGVDRELIRSRTRNRR